MEQRLFQLHEDGVEVARCSIHMRTEDWVALEEVVVMTSRRGSGLGRRVCEEALNWCRERDVNILVTACPIFDNGLDEHQLKAFYESMGFVLLHTSPGRYYLELINNPAKARPTLTERQVAHV